MTILGYQVSEIRKAMVAGILAIAAIVGLFIQVDPNFTQALIVLGGSVLTVVVTFMTKNHTWDDVSKAINALEVAFFTASGYVITVPTTTVEKIVAATGVVLTFVGVLVAKNEAA